MKKLISVIMAVAMMISMSVVSFAAESVTNLADFKAAIATGEVTLGADIVLDEKLMMLPIPIETEPESEKPTESSSSPICQPPTNDPRTDYTGVIITVCIVACAIVGIVAFVFIKKSKK